MKKRHWNDYLWIWPIVYFSLGYFNILFAWLGMIDFILPLLFAVFGGNKAFCNRYCGRGMLLERCGKCSVKAKTPRVLSARWFRYGFLVFFLAMFGSMIFQTWLVASGAESLKEGIRLLWMFGIPWSHANAAESVPGWIVQFGYGFYSLMLTSTVIGLAVNVMFRPRSWCCFCPMGTMTQIICRLKAKGRKS